MSTDKYHIQVCHHLRGDKSAPNEYDQYVQSLFGDTESRRDGHVCVCSRQQWQCWARPVSDSLSFVLFAGREKHNEGRHSCSSILLTGPYIICLSAKYNHLTVSSTAILTSAWHYSEFLYRTFGYIFGIDWCSRERWRRLQFPVSLLTDGGRETDRFQFSLTKFAAV